jgi:hypothetical protein
MSQENSKDALEPAFKECELQMKALDEVIEKLLPERNESRTKKGMRALRSLWDEAKMEKITSIIRGFVSTFTFHAVASSRPSGDMIVPFLKQPQQL